MKKEAFRALISLTVFVLCLALTFPFVTGLTSFTSIKEIFLPAEESTESEDTYDPYDPSWLFTTAAETEAPATPAPAETTVSPETGTAAADTDEVTSEPAESSTEVLTTEEPTTEEITTVELNKDTYPWTTVDKSYFDDALFIGDSRTARMMLTSKGRLEGAHFFAGEGWTCAYAMNRNASDFTVKQLSSELYNQKGVLPMVFNGANANGHCNEVGRMNLETALITYQYKKVYIMFGINEIGYAASSVYNNVARMVSMCLSLCPGCTVYVEGNLLMTAEYSAASKYGKNDKLIAINDMLATLANWDNILYVDINDLMGDGNGNASTEYSDGGHQKWSTGSVAWAEWLYTKGKANP